MKRWGLGLALCILMFIASPIVARNGSLLDGLEPITAANASRIKQVAELKCECQSLTDIAWSPDGSTLAIASAGNVWLYSPLKLDSPPIFLKGSTYWIDDIAFSPNGKLLAAANSTLYSPMGNQVIVWNLAQKTKQTTLHFDQSIDAISFQGDDTLLSSDGSYMRAWDIDNAAIIGRFPLKGIDNRILSTTFSHDNTLMAIGVNQGATLIWNVDTGKQVATWDDGYTQDLAFSFNDQLLGGAYLGYTGLLHLKDAVHDVDFIPHLRAVYDLAFSPNDNLLAQVEFELSSGGFRLRLYNIAPCDAEIPYFGRSCQPLATFAQGVFDRNLYEIHIAFNPAGTLMASVSQDDLIRFWGVRRQGESS